MRIITETSNLRGRSTRTGRHSSLKMEKLILYLPKCRDCVPSSFSLYKHIIGSFGHKKSTPWTKVIGEHWAGARQGWIERGNSSTATEKPGFRLTIEHHHLGTRQELLFLYKSSIIQEEIVKYRPYEHFTMWKSQIPGSLARKTGLNAKLAGLSQRKVSRCFAVSKPSSRNR